MTVAAPIKWILTESDAGVAAALSGQTGIHPLIARLMVSRGITDPADVRAFLSCELAALSGPGDLRWDGKGHGQDQGCYFRP